MTLLITWLVTSIAVWITAAVLPGFHIKNFGSAILGLAWLLAFITRWIINAILLKITDALTSHLKIDNFGWALVGALMISLVSTLTQWLLSGLA